MTENEFIDKYIDEYAGAILGGGIRRTDAEYSLWCRNVHLKSREKLREFYRIFNPPPPLPVKPETNGKAGEGVKRLAPINGEKK